MERAVFGIILEHREEEKKAGRNLATYQHRDEEKKACRNLATYQRRDVPTSGQ